MNVKNMLLALVAMAVMLVAAPAQAEKTIMLGYSLPLTGSHAQYGEGFRNAATLQLERFNKSGKLKGATVDILFEDSKSDPKEAINIARKFVDNEQIVGVLGDFTSTVSMAAGRVYAMEGMPQLSQTASHPDFTKVGKYQFRNITTQAFEGPFVAKWAESLGYKKFAIVAIQNDWGISAAENFETAIKNLGGEITAVEYFNPGNRDFRSILTKVSRDKPEAIYLCMMYEEGAMILQQRRQLGIDITTFGTSSLYSPKLVELAGEAANGLMLSTTFMPDSPEPHVVEFVTEYKKQFNADPNMFTAQAYDAVGIMLDAIAKVGTDVTRESLRDALAATTDYPGVTGATSFDPETREPVKGLARMTVENGAFKLVK
ncbi:ABC transporter substrate-binding protein [Pseudodesulfovibrio sediminis]|uniref:Amino acid ABC transporter substrate-binding protein n=1 Tax=Pseudodesulfovibrio sediminis TaxID=2810563 RepID=A0ABM7P9V3_9BACT|nr:ABC transporter substrate-binding protein [Pseudodesulfovibrio sediminis]BCS89849.1 amino acid ABC transporter substrate-binding protein [Pseudodesulfovibrio sediminis]